MLLTKLLLTNNNKSTMVLAWSNSRTACKYHGKGTPAQYLADSLKLAHKGLDLKRSLWLNVALASSASFLVGLGYGVLLASI